MSTVSYRTLQQHSEALSSRSAGNEAKKNNSTETYNDVTQQLFKLYLEGGGGNSSLSEIGCNISYAPLSVEKQMSLFTLNDENFAKSAEASLLTNAEDICYGLEREVEDASSINRLQFGEISPSIIDEVSAFVDKEGVRGEDCLEGPQEDESNHLRYLRLAEIDYSESEYEDFCYSGAQSQSIHLSFSSPNAGDIKDINWRGFCFDQDRGGGINDDTHDAINSKTDLTNVHDSVTEVPYIFYHEGCGYDLGNRVSLDESLIVPNVAYAHSINCMPYVEIIENDSQQDLARNREELGAALMSQVAKAMKFSKSGENSFSIKLWPEGMGAIEMNYKIKEGHIPSLVLKSNNMNTVLLLEKQLGDFRDIINSTIASDSNENSIARWQLTNEEQDSSGPAIKLEYDLSDMMFHGEEKGGENKDQGRSEQENLSALQTLEMEGGSERGLHLLQNTLFGKIDRQGGPALSSIGIEGISMEYGSIDLYA